MDFVERRIEQAQRAGFFDNLELHGQPIPDLDTERPEGWWADQFLDRDKAQRQLVAVAQGIPLARNTAWREDNHDEVRRKLIRINQNIAEVNELVERRDRLELLDVEAEMATWREQRRQRLWGRYLNS